LGFEVVEVGGIEPRCAGPGRRHFERIPLHLARIRLHDRPRRAFNAHGLASSAHPSRSKLRRSCADSVQTPEPTLEAFAEIWLNLTPAQRRAVLDLVRVMRGGQ
jgi:hypothetical protein